jgi:fido (protein-threonine AMPylation protein)
MSCNNNHNNSHDTSKRRCIGGIRSSRRYPAATAHFTATSEGINKLVEHEFPVLVWLLSSSTTSSQDRIYDGKETLSVELLPSVQRQIQQSHERPDDILLIRIHGILERPHQAPNIVLASAEYVRFAHDHEVNPIRSHSATCNPRSFTPNPRVGGYTPVFLQQWAPFLSNEELAGTTTSTYSTRSNASDSQRPILNFFQQHAARQTLQRQQQHTNSILHSTTNHDDNHNNSSNGSENNSDTASSQQQVYWKALQEFQQTQMDKQSASLTSNAGRETAAVAEKVVAQHRKALEQALQDESTPLTPQLLMQWHAILLQGLHAQAGQYRTKIVKVGLTQFQSPANLTQDMETACHILETVLRSRLLHQPQTAMTFAAAVFMAIVDVHPFADGNGRLARIALNWAVRVAGFPISIHWCATQQQRHEYSQAIMNTRRNLHFQAYGDVHKEQLLEAYQTFGAFRPLVEWIVQRWNKTIVEWENVLRETSAHAQEHDEARAARRVRERAAAGSCLICLDDSPNISTLCCGKAVHLNCMAEWLAQQNTCPQCRNELPALSRPPNANNSIVPANNNTESVSNDDEDTNSTMEGPGFWQQIVIDQIAQHIQNNNINSGNNSNNSQNDTESTNSTEEDEIQEADANDTSVASGNGVIPEGSETMEFFRSIYGPDFNPNDTNDTNDTTESVNRPPTPPPFCSYNQCNNRSARDCANDACGKCCVTWGQYGCQRHNTSY